MKQVKKLLVILPLVALFVLGSLPVLAAGVSKDEVKAKLKEISTRLEQAEKNADKERDEVDQTDWWITKTDLSDTKTKISRIGLCPIKWCKK